MKKVFLVFLLGFWGIIVCCATNPRTITSINESWKFAKGDFQKSTDISFNDSKWKNVTIPHTWNDKDAIDETPGFFRGTGWYRRTINIPNSYYGKQIFIALDGVNQEAEIFVNGKTAGKHVGGYTRFGFDISNYILYGKKNTLVIKVNNQYNENIPPLTADFTFFGGIYRDVNLIVTEKQHIATNYYASSGVFITAPTVSEKEAKINIKAFVTNDDKTATKLQIENSIYSANGELILSKSSSIKIPANSTLTVVQNDLKVENPILWSPDSPILYKVVTRVYDAKKKVLLDEIINPMGLRWFEFTADKGFFLNGKSLKLIGTNRHQTYLNMGNALSDEIHVSDIKLLKEMGANFLRVSHYPQDHILMEMCDKLGIICSVEIPIVNTITENEQFSSNCLTMAREMVMQDFNRPSVLIWTYMNEVLLRLPFKGDSVRNAEYFKNVELLASKIEKQIREDDNIRYTMIPAHGSLEAYMNAGLADIPKIVGFNLYQGWYSGIFSGFEQFLDNAKQKIPNKPFIISEYGADVDPRLHSFNSQRFDYTQEYANLYHEHYIKAIMKRPYISGAVIWNLNDFYSEERAYAVPHVNLKGIVSLNREKKDTYLQYQAMLIKKPVISIAGMNWKIRGGNADSKGVCFQPVKVYSNQKTVALSLNGISLGTQAVVDNIAQFMVPFTNENNELDAISEENSYVRDQLKVDFHLIPFNLKTQDQPFTYINVMLGSNRYFEDKANSVIWLPEKEYTAGSWGFVGGEPYTKKTRYGAQPASDLDILGTTNDPIFQTARVGIESFKMDVSDGKYTVYFYWAELQSNQDVQTLAYNLGNDALKENFFKRIFDVNFNGHVVLKDLDLTNDFGFQRAVIKKIEVDVTNGEGINIQFVKRQGETLLNAIRIYRNY